MEAFGLDDLVDDLDRAAATVGKRANGVRDETKGAIRETAVDLAPIDDGELRAGIQETQDGVESTAGHAIPVEFGTYKDAPQPHMWPATDEHEGSFVEGLEDVAGDI